VDKEVEVDAVHKDDEVGVCNHRRVDGDSIAWWREQCIAVGEVVVVDVYRNLGEHLVAGNGGAAKGDGSTDIKNVECPPDTTTDLHA